MGHPVVWRPLPAGVVYVCDDDVFSRQLAGWLEESGVRVRRAFSAEEALYARSFDPCAGLLVDLSSTEMQGIDAVMRLREEGDDAPVVAFSSLPNVAQHCDALGLRHFIGQPFRLGDLVALIEEAVMDRLAPERSIEEALFASA